MTNMHHIVSLIKPVSLFLLCSFFSSRPSGSLCVVGMQFLKQGGDIFHDLVVHDADFVMHLLQERPTKVILYVCVGCVHIYNIYYILVLHVCMYVI